MELMYFTMIMVGLGLGLLMTGIGFLFGYLKEKVVGGYKKERIFGDVVYTNI